MDTTIKYTESEKVFSEIIAKNRSLFEKKNKDYGSSWVILRYSNSFTDQIFIKAKRVREIQKSGKNMVGDPLSDEFIGIFNYCIMALMKHSNAERLEKNLSIPVEELLVFFDEQVQKIYELRQKKNHDYGEAWRDMRISSITDLILMKLVRIKQIETNNGATLVSEPIEPGFQDIANYALFALVLIQEGASPMH